MAETESKEGEKKSSKKLIVIIAMVLLLLGGGAGGYFFFMHQPASDEHGKEAEHGGKTAEENHAAEEEKADEHEQDPAAHAEVYYQITEPLLVNFPPNASAKIIKISVTVLLKGEANVAVMKKHEPMIRNNLLMAISSIGADKAKTLEGKKELQTMMQNEVGKVMELMTKKNPVQAVYFTDFVMQ